MASMFPKKIPFHVSADPFRSTEIDVFSQLETQLSSEYTVFYSRPWLGLNASGEEIDGEADFVIAHPVFGILTLEVKGGRISYDSGTDSWRSKDRHGFTNLIKDPVYQARTCKHRILEKLSEDKRSDIPRIRARHGVLFPHTSSPHESLGADRPLALFCFSEEYPDVGTWVKNRMGASSGLTGREQPLGANGLARCVDVLAKSFELRVPAAVSILAEERQIDYLSSEQCSVLDFIAYHKRCGIAGPAGTGKTVLAIEKAFRCAESGLSTLVLCFNRPLANHLKTKIHHASSIEVCTFHEYVLARALSAGVAHSLSYKSDPEEWAALLLSAAQEEPKAIGALVVDEGQDFDESWWGVLDLMLDSDSLLYVFYDSQQQFYSMPSSFLRLMPPSQFPLTYNLRNTRKIFDAAKPWFGAVAVSPKGPQGDPVKWIEMRKVSELDIAVARLMQHLTRVENVRSQQIAILTTSELIAEQLRNSAHLRSFAPEAAGSISQRGVIVSGVKRFKGLDSSVVILVLADEHLPDAELLYVGLTRARSLMYVLALPAVTQALSQRIEAGRTH